MEKTNFTFVRPFGLAMVLSVLFTILGLQVANAQCNPPAPGAGPIVTTQSSASLSWTSTSLPLPPNDHCWVLQVASQSVLLQGANGCPRAGEAIVQTTICANGVFGAPGSTTTSSNPNVTVVRNGANSFTATVNGLPAGTQLRWFINELCDGIALPNFTDCVEGAPFTTRDAQFTVDVTRTPLSCPEESPGYTPDATITVTVTDGSTCAGTYTVIVTPNPNSNPGPILFAPATPPAVVVGPVVGNTFSFSGAGPSLGSYMITVMETSGCNPVTNPVIIPAFQIPNPVDAVQPIFYITDLLGNIFVDNDLGTPQGTTLTLPNITVPEGECGHQDEFFSSNNFDLCDGIIQVANALTATAVTTTPATIVPGTQVSPPPYGDGVGTYQVGVHWSTGTSTVSFFGRDASGNIANGPAGLQITATVLDNIDPDCNHRGQQPGDDPGMCYNSSGTLHGTSRRPVRSGSDLC